MGAKVWRGWVMAALLVSRIAFSHPVSFKDGIEFMAFHQPDMQDWELIYSFERNLSVGASFFRDTMDANRERFFLIPKFSWLVHRWNGENAQANLYLSGGVGGAKRNDGIFLAGEGAIEADYETRKIYVSAKANGLFSKNLETFLLYQGRVGVAPYVGYSGDLHTWLIAQVQYLPFAEVEPYRVSPVLRFFYKNVLWELGVSARGTWSFNCMVHF